MVDRDKEIEEFETTEGYEICSSCGWKNIDDEELPQEGAPISGVYPVCPRCGKDWKFEEVITRKTAMVRMTKEHFEKLVKAKTEHEHNWFFVKETRHYVSNFEPDRKILVFACHCGEQKKVISQY